MEIVFDNIGVFDFSATENITLTHKGITYQAEVEISGGEGLDISIEVLILEHGLNSDLEEELIKEIEDQFKRKYKLSRKF